MVKRMKLSAAIIAAGIVVAACDTAVNTPTATEAGGTAAGLAASAEADTEFFRDKTVTYIVATAPGGGYDTYGRMLARHMQEHLPGSRFLVRNIPGAGQIIGANTIYVSQPDGLTFGIFNTGLIYAQILEQEGVRFDLGRMSWIGKMAEEGRSLAISGNSDFETVEDLLNAEMPIMLSAAGIGSASYIETRIMADVMDLDVQIITGFDGGETQLSMLRGELDGVLGAASSNLEFVERGDGKFLLSIAGARSQIPGVPQVREYATDSETLRLLNLVETMAELGRLTAGPPGIPSARLRALRDAFNAAIADPDLHADAERMQIPVTAGTGEEVEQKVMMLLDQPPEVVERLREAANGT
jgi:tripartite-type tricarboxylate transporter receptor subunit TctC